MANDQILDMVLDQIIREPSTHDQSTWDRPSEESSCGTTRCVAGWAVYFSDKFDIMYNDSELSYPVRKGTTQPISWYIAGAEALEIDHRAAQNIFMDMNEARVIDKLKDIKNGDFSWQN